MGFQEDIMEENKVFSILDRTKRNSYNQHIMYITLSVGNCHYRQYSQYIVNIEMLAHFYYIQKFKELKIFWSFFVVDIFLLHISCILYFVL